MALHTASSMILDKDSLWASVCSSTTWVWKPHLPPGLLWGVNDINRYMVFLMVPNNSKHSINYFYSIIIIIIIMQFTGFYPVLPGPQRLQREWLPHPPCIPLWWGRVTAVFNLPFQTMQLCLCLFQIPNFCRRAHLKKSIFCYQNFFFFFKDLFFYWLIDWLIDCYVGSSFLC